MKVSFIVPVYKVEKFLPRCLDSILAQTFGDWEAVCVNDGSPDSCGAILREYAARDPRFVVVDKPNGGLSDARNAGMALAKGEWVVFVDSDDFIHPQTLEIALSIQERSKADMVSWYKDKKYRNVLIFRHVFHLDTIAFKPAAYCRKYDAPSVSYDFTDDIFSVATELTHQKEIARPVKHCYVWRHLIRRDLLDGISFIKGLSFEDFPWWSSVMLKNPSIAYTSLPLYFYYINLDSIDVGSSRPKKVSSWVKGLESAVDEYTRKATPYQLERWNLHFKWPVIRIHIACFLPKLDRDNQYVPEIVAGLKRLSAAGAFSNPSTQKDIKAVRAIEDFIASAQ